MLDSQTRAFVAQSNLIALRRARLANRVDLHLALGGGFESPPLAALDRSEESDEADEEDPS